MFDLFHNGDTADSFESWASIAGHDPSSNTSDLSSEGFANLFPRPYDPDLEASSTGWTPQADVAASGKAEPTYGPMSTYGNGEPTEVEEVVITARPGMPIDEINQILDDLYGGNGFDPNVPPTGGGSEQPTDWNPCQDGEADDLASDVRDAIADMADSDRTEYGSFTAMKTETLDQRPFSQARIMPGRP